MPVKYGYDTVLGKGANNEQVESTLHPAIALPFKAA